MYPIATSFDWQVDKEMTVFSGSTHVDNLERYYGLISQMLLDPGFREDDFKRLKEDAINFLKVSLRESNDEELGKEALYNRIYEGHPYGHHNIGIVQALEKLALSDVREFYRQNYTRGNLVIGLSGAYPATFSKRLEADFGKLPNDSTQAIKIPPPKTRHRWEMDIIARETRSTAISLGFPIQVRRGHKDWPALALAVAYFGQHRSSNGLLYQRLREARGLNYGDYAYLEYFPRGMYQFQPDPGLGRQQQIFQIWIRPVEPQNGHFALRAALYEFDKLVREGLSKAAFEATRAFLMKNVDVLTQTQDAQLGYALDSRYYGIAEFNTYMRSELGKLTLEDVNGALRRHLKTDAVQIVVVTKDATSFREAIVSNKTSPITYNSPKSDALLEEDKVIASHKLPIASDAVRILPVDQIF
jgi:zinc protease